MSKEFVWNKESMEELVFPLGRVKRIMRKDKDLRCCKPEATLVLTKAVELFISQIAQGATDVARSQGKRTTTLRHILSYMDKNGQYDFLQGNMPEPAPLKPKQQTASKKAENNKRKRQAAEPESGQGTLSWANAAPKRPQRVIQQEEEEEEEEEVEEEVEEEPENEEEEEEQQQQQSKQQAEQTTNNEKEDDNDEEDNVSDDDDDDSGRDEPFRKPKKIIVEDEDE